MHLERDPVDVHVGVIARRRDPDRDAELPTPNPAQREAVAPGVLRAAVGVFRGAIRRERLWRAGEVRAGGLAIRPEELDEADLGAAGPKTRPGI